MAEHKIVLNNTKFKESCESTLILIKTLEIMRKNSCLAFFD